MEQGGFLERRALSVDEAAHVMKLGRTKIYELISTGSLSSVKIGRRRLILKASVDRLLTPEAA